VWMWERVTDHRLAKKCRREKVQKNQSPYIDIIDINDCYNKFSSLFINEVVHTSIRFILLKS